MPRPIPHTVHARWPDRPATRYASTISTDAPHNADLALLGMPDDTGILLNHGRPGACDGPAAFRRALARYGVSDPVGFAWPLVYDAGDVPPAGRDPKAINETHAHVKKAASALLGAGLLPVGIGGGHDLTYPFVGALAEHLDDEAGLEVVYFDPHLDVREEVGSGMPFRALGERAGVKALHNFGASGMVNSAAHSAWFGAHGGEVHPRSTLKDFFARPGGPLAVSLDLDCLDAAYAPGVSAMNPCGWTPETASEAAFFAGQCPRVRAFDIMELSPPHDQSERTARLAAHLFLSFLRGYALRTAG